MPEGDTLYRIANKLRPILAGQLIQEATTWRPRNGAPIDAASIRGRRVESVEANGKHLLITLDDQRVVHTHLGMTGSWHAYARDAAWKKPAHRAALTLATATHVAVCFTPKQLELVSAARLRGDRYLRRLGPDLMLAETNVAEVLPRLRRHNAATLGEAVMNQTILAGVGNVYKSESLYLAKLNPWNHVGSSSDEQLLSYLQLTQKLMRRNRRGGLRTTRVEASGPRLWVYGRRGEPCLKCGGVIHMSRQGDLGRSTYWCPACQPAGPGATPPATDDRRMRTRPPIKGCG